MIRAFTILALVIFMVGCGEGDESPTAAVATGGPSCDISITFMGVSDHQCIAGATMTADYCTQAGTAIASFGGVAAHSTDGCIAGAVLLCPRGEITTHYYTPEADDTCESLAEEEA